MRYCTTQVVKKGHLNRFFTKFFAQQPVRPLNSDEPLIRPVATNFPMECGLAEALTTRRQEEPCVKVAALRELPGAHVARVEWGTAVRTRQLLKDKYGCSTYGRGGLK
jgi:hypothetical protein